LAKLDAAWRHVPKNSILAYQFRFSSLKPPISTDGYYSRDPINVKMTARSTNGITESVCFSISVFL
jgi:hypothetical protein